MKNIKRILLAGVFIGVTFCLVWLWRPGYTVPILTYHSIGHHNDLLTVTPEHFDGQLAYLKAHDYKVIPLDELVEGINSNRRFGHKTVVITFDDGLKDNYQYAYPVLRKYHFPAIIFLAANLIDNKAGFLSWVDVRAMQKGHIAFGAHTRNHVHLASIKSNEDLWDEIAGSKGMIEQNINAPVYYFSYPFGAFNGNVKSIVKKSGFKGACTTNVGPKRFNEDIYALKRIRVKDSDMDKPLTFWAKLSGYYNLFRRPRLEVEP